MKQLVFVVVLVLISSGVTPVDFTFQNVTVEWIFDSERYVLVSSKLTNSMKEMYPKNVTSSTGTKATIKGKMNTLYENSFGDVTDLQELNMTNIGLRKIQAETFKNLPNLENLHLGHNSLFEIKAKTFVGLKYCHFINLSSSQISVLEPGAFQNLTYLSFLYLSKNRIEEIRRDVFHNITVRVLDLSDNLITKVENGFLEKVFFLRGLNVYLVLSNNKLEEVNPNAFSHPKLTHLYLTNNTITQLHPGDLKNLPDLQFLELRGNKLEEIRRGVFNDVNKLISLDLSHNKISFISSDAFDNMEKLRVVHIDHNKIKTWDNRWFAQSSTLVAVFASNNLIEEIPEQAFKNYRNIFLMDLQSNKIRVINSLAFYNGPGNPTTMKYLILRNNEIKEWKYSLVSYANVALYGMDLRGNKLTCLEGDINKTFRHVIVVWLSDNPYRTECARRIENYTLQHQNYQTPERLLNMIKYI